MRFTDSLDTVIVASSRILYFRQIDNYRVRWLWPPTREELTDIWLLTVFPGPSIASIAFKPIYIVNLNLFPISGWRKRASLYWQKPKALNNWNSWGRIVDHRIHFGSSLGRLVVPKGEVSRTGFGEEDFKASGQLRLIPSISLLSAKRHSSVVSSHGRSLHPPPAPHGHLREPRFKYSEVDILSRLYQEVCAYRCTPQVPVSCHDLSMMFHQRIRVAISLK